MHVGLWTALILVCAPVAASCKQSTALHEEPTKIAQPAPAMRRGMMGQGMMGGGMMSGSYVRHHAVMVNGIPEPYRSMRDPLSDTPATLERGARTYQRDCAACHGPHGQGDGPAGQQLNPPAANLALLGRTRMGQWDGYLYWTIAEGGEQFGTAMPSFKNALSPENTWALIDYLRHGLSENARQH
jgi:mono/diheme cytochrome c family protein